jgi:hypothetical protein
MMSLTSLHRVFAPNGICLTRLIQSVDRRVELHEPEVILDWVDSDADKRVLPSSDTSPSFRMGSVRKIEGGIVTRGGLFFTHDPYWLPDQQYLWQKANECGLATAEDLLSDTHVDRLLCAAGKESWLDRSE